MMTNQDRFERHLQGGQVDPLGENEKLRLNFMWFFILTRLDVERCMREKEDLFLIV